MLNLESLAALANHYRDALPTRVATLAIGNRVFDFNTQPAIMGVINLSGDSWYRESVSLNPAQAIRRAHVLTAQGADFVDIGAESTLAHAARQNQRSQIRMLLPVLRELAKAGILVSVETYEPAVARECLRAGAKMINYTGTQQCRKMFRMAAEFEAALILCYVQGSHVRSVGNLDFTADPIEQMYAYFARLTEVAGHCGLNKMILDPGLGFYYRNLQDSSRRIDYQMRTFLSTFRLRTLGWPLCHALPHAFEFFGEEVRCAEPFFAVLAALGKTDLFRTHEVPRIKAVLDTMAVFTDQSHGADQ